MTGGPRPDAAAAEGAAATGEEGGRVLEIRLIKLQRPQIQDPASLPWHEVRKVGHYWLSVDAVRDPMRVREEPPSLESDHQ